MAPKKLTIEERIARAAERGCTQETMDAREATKNQRELREIADATKDKHSDAWDIWLEFLSVRGFTDSNTALSLPSPEFLKSFAEYYGASRDGRIRSRDGRIRDTPHVDSVCNMISRFSGAFTQRTSIEISQEVMKDVHNAIKGSIQRKLGLTTQNVQKFLVTQKDLDVMMEFLWCQDIHDFPHELYRVQLSFVIVLFSMCGPRAGAIVESSSYRGSNEALKYRDIKVKLLRRADGSTRWKIVITQSLLKGCRNDENENLEIVLDERDNVSNCGIFWFFAIALAANAFKFKKSLQELLSTSVPDGRETVTIKFEDFILDRPVLRMASPSGVDNIRALTFAAVWGQATGTSKRLGNRDPFRFHGIRASVSNKLSQNVSEAELQRILAHKTPSQYYRSYQSHISRIDSQAIMLGGTQSEEHLEHIELLQSLGENRDKNAPKELPAAELAKFKSRPDIEELNRQITEITRIINKKPKEHPELFFQRQQLYTQKANKLKAAKEVYRRKWFEHAYEEDETSVVATATFEELRQFMPARDYIASHLRTTVGLRCSSAQRMIEHLVTLCQDDNQVAYRPNEWPINGSCPAKSCAIVIASLKPHMRSNHVHRCRQREIRESGQRPSDFSRKNRNRKLPFAEYCYLCCDWICSISQWDEHCKMHLADLPKRCGLLTFRYTLIRGGYCPFCLGNADLQASRRMQTWIKKPTLIDHINGHIRALDWRNPCLCPHPLCDLALPTKEEFHNHLYDIHSIQEPRQTCLSRKRKFEETVESL